MQRLNKSITHAVDRPVKVMQFGEGNFLRAFVDYIFDVTNEKTDFNGGVVIVKPIEFGTLERFHDQECQYTLQLRGFVDGEPKEITRQITSVVDAVAAIEDYDKYIEYGTSETLRFIVSNTTEAGIVFDETDNDPNARPPKTYPGKPSAATRRLPGGNGCGRHGRTPLRRTHHPPGTLSGRKPWRRWKRRR